jgi:hypothetical protein
VYPPIENAAIVEKHHDGSTTEAYATEHLRRLVLFHNQRQMLLRCQRPSSRHINGREGV